MKKNLILSLGLSIALFSACQKEKPQIKASDTTKETSSSKLKVNTVQPGGSTQIYLQNGRYHATIGGFDADLGNIYYYTGAYNDGEAVVAVDNYSIGGPYIAFTYYYLAGGPDFQLDVKKFNDAYKNYISGSFDPKTGEPYTLPNPDGFIKQYYGSVEVFRGIIVRDHSAPTTLVLKEATFTPVAPATNQTEVSLGGVQDPSTGLYWILYGKAGKISKAYNYSNGAYNYAFSFGGTYTGTQSDYHVIGNVKPTSDTQFSFDAHINPL